MKAYSLLLFVIAMFYQSINVIAQDKPDPSFVEIYFENREGERVTEVTYSDEYVYMVIVSKNAIGEKFIMELDEEDEDYIYKKKYLSTGSRVEEKIKGDIHKIKLIIFNPANKQHIKIRKKYYKKRKKKEADSAK